jgi:uncharacterized membrane protein
MTVNFLTNWLFLAIVSAVATTLLIVLSWEALGGMHSSLIMALRVLGVTAIVAPVVVYVLWNGTTGLDIQTISRKSITLWIGIAVSAGVSWYSFYLALEYGKQAGASIAFITTINYASVVLILVASWLLGQQKMDGRNLLGVALVVAGVYFVSVKPKANSGPQSPPTATQG